MSVYVDDAKNPYGHLIMSHMVADNHYELMQMARRLALKPEWLQRGGTYREHFDISQTKRRAAIKFGAIPVNSRDLVRITSAKR